MGSVFVRKGSIEEVNGSSDKFEKSTAIRCRSTALAKHETE
jgi:hypothetical protein